MDIQPRVTCLSRSIDFLKNQDPFEQGKKAFQNNDFKTAEAFFTKATKENPSFTLYEFRCSTYEKLNKPDLAYQDAMKMLALNEKCAKGYIRAGRALKKLNQHQKAQKIYNTGKEKVYKDDPLYQILENSCEVKKVAVENMRVVKSEIFASRNRDFLNLLPTEIVHEIVGRLPLKSLCMTASVSKAWRKFINSSPILWRNLDFNSNQRAHKITDQTIRVYAKRGGRHVRSFICMDATSITDTGLKYLAEVRCNRIQQLEITLNNKISGSRFTIFIKTVGSRLTTINLLGTLADSQTIRAILETCINLKSLNLSYCKKIGEKAFNPELVRSKACNLNELCLRDCPAASKEALSYFAIQFPKLVKFDLRNDTDLTITAFESLGNFPDLECIRMNSPKSESNMGRSFEEICVSVASGCTQVREFDMRFGSLLTDNCILALVSQWGDLQVLDLQGNTQLSDVAMQHIGNNCTKLRVLRIGVCPQVTDRGVMLVASPNGCNLLEGIEISQNGNITNASLEAIAEYLPGIIEINIRCCSKINGRAIVNLVLKRGTNLKYLAVEGCVDIAKDAILYARKIIESRGGRVSHIMREGSGRRLFA
ncbi:hypothetical protein G9A89_017155 [Geosiphon pyriformis]|nr:hypothetical protein G9A89_017155 [Geosiphon pyriformis]